MFLLALLLDLLVVTSADELGLEFTCIPGFEIGDFSIPEICMELWVDVCEEEISIYAEVDGEVVVDESVADFDDFELCYELDDTDCDICVRTRDDVIVSPEYVSVCLETFSRCDVFGFPVEYGLTDLGCIEQGVECNSQTSCGDCVDAGCGWCDDRCLPLQTNGEDIPWCDTCPEGIYLECPSDESALSSGSDAGVIDENGDVHLGDPGFLYFVFGVGSIAMLLLLIACGYLLYRRTSQRRLVQAQYMVQASADDLELPAEINLSDPDIGDIGDDDRARVADNYDPPASL